tara:strand:+ start:1220 stop:1828 length:609 start_codon:yes stop_codon:yes gene_type:complete
MPLWGTAHASATNKPKFLPEDEDSNYNRAACYATESGWVMQAGHASSGNSNTSADPEVLVAIGGLAGATDTTGLRAPTVTKMRFVTASLVNGGSKTMTVEITWDEEVTVAGSPQIVVANGNQSSDGDGNATLTYTATGSTANRKRFTNASLTFSTNDVYTLGGSNISLNSGTISDTVRGGTAQAASLVLSGLTAVTKTVVAS